MVEGMFCGYLYRFGRASNRSGAPTIYPQSDHDALKFRREFSRPVTVKSITAVAATFNTNAYRAFMRNVRDTTQEEKHP